MLEARAPRFAEHTFKHADDLGTDIRLAGGITELKRVKSDRIGRIGGVKIDDIVDAVFRDKAEVIDGEVAMRVDNTVALIIKDVAECKKLEHPRFTSASLTDNIDMAGTVAAEHAELVVDATEIGEPEGGDVFVVGSISGDEGQCGRRLGSLRSGPDDVGSLDGSVW